MASRVRGWSDGGMRTSPRVRIEPQPSRFLRLALPMAAAATALLVAMLPLHPVGVVAALAVVAALLTRALRATCGRGLPALVHVGIDHRITVTGADGRSRDGVVHAASFVDHRVTSVVWVPDGTPRLIACFFPESFVLVPDMLVADDFRRLRTVLRHGHAMRGDTSGRLAGRPSSQAAASMQAPRMPASLPRRAR